jgi:hypothetical protein
VRISIGDVVTARIVKVDLPRRELNLAIIETIARSGRKHADQPQKSKPSKRAKPAKSKGKPERFNKRPKQQALKRRRRRHG